MTREQEIALLREQIRTNQSRFAHWSQQRNNQAMRQVQQHTRELIDRLSMLQEGNKTDRMSCSTTEQS